MILTMQGIEMLFFLMLYVVMHAGCASEVNLPATFTLTYEGNKEEKTPRGTLNTPFKSVWMKDEASGSVLKERIYAPRIREHDLRVMNKASDEFELYVPKDDNSFYKYSGSKIKNVCKIATVNTLPGINLTRFEYKGVQDINGQPTSQWTLDTIRKPAWSPKKTVSWYFWNLDDTSEFNVPVKFDGEYRGSLIPHTPYNFHIEWSLTSFAASVDGEMFGLPQACK